MAKKQSKSAVDEKPQVIIREITIETDEAESAQVAVETSTEPVEPVEDTEVTEGTESAKSTEEAVVAETDAETESTEETSEEIIQTATTETVNTEPATAARVEKPPTKSPSSKIMPIICSILLIGAVIFGLIWAVNTCSLPLSDHCRQPVVEEPIPTPTPMPINQLAGIVSLSGLVPDATDTAEIRILVRPFTEDGGLEFMDINFASTTVRDNLTWQWNDAIRGSNYEVVAAYMENGNIIKRSPIETVTSPALDIELDLNLTWADLPNTTPTRQNTSIIGNVVVNGYVPEASTVTLTAVPAEDLTGASGTSFTLAWPTGTSNLPFTWEEAVLGDSYQILATLNDADGQLLGQQIKSALAQAGDHKVTLTINSMANPSLAISTESAESTESTQAAISSLPSSILSGTVLINGPVNVDSSILILVRRHGAADYTPVSRIQNPDNVRQAWSWDQAELGQQYEVTMVLQLDEDNTSAPANSKIMAAPAKNIDFTLNTSFSPPRPEEAPDATSCVRDGSQWKTTLQFPAAYRAGNYWVQVGSGEGFSDVLHEKFAAPEGDFSINVRVSSDKEYFARYAYTFCADCNSDLNFSLFSQSLAFTCP